ncbi:hypothetical protein TCDM_09457 [Trypanosoma cruzi Dm28c]|uniref:Uncharacterized protein n=1 Tax=Trypanosoma cruzi Dm28c TaxID=1416333 RepID=V5B5E8_TRYCR|nr:hypothetical protein TCDM_09457 [Trypanosoma cruzi Dm28c]
MELHGNIGVVLKKKEEKRREFTLPDWCPILFSTFPTLSLSFLFRCCCFCCCFLFATCLAAVLYFLCNMITDTSYSRYAQYTYPFGG